MKVIHVCPFIGEQIGGSERYVDTLSRMQSRHHDVHIFTTTKNKHLAGVTTDNNCQVHRFYSPVVLWNINPIAYMFSQIRKSDADILHVHSHLYTISNQAVLSKYGTKSKVLLQLHGGVGAPPYQASWKRRLTKMIYDKTLGSFTIKASDMITSVSRKDLHTVEHEYNIPKENLRYVPNAVDLRKFSPSSTRKSLSETNFLYVGDLEKWKGVGLLVDWIDKLSHSINEPINWTFVGQGTYYSRIRKLKIQCERDTCSRIHLYGQRSHDEIPAFMRKASALLFPSYWEGMPTVVLEAMASGTPVISTEVGDLPDLLSNMENSIVIKRHFESFRNAVHVISHNPEIAWRLGNNARKDVEKIFGFERIDALLSNLYSEIIERYSPSVNLR